MSDEKVLEQTKTVEFQTESPPGRGALDRARGQIIDGYVPTEKRSRFRLAAAPMPKIPFYLATFILFVVVTSFASVLYFAWLASDQFVVESRFAIRNAPNNKSVTDDVKSMLSSAAMTGTSNLASQDAMVVVQYLRSRSAIEDISKSVDLRAIYSRPGIDFWARLPSNASAEELTDYWRGMVFTAVDAPSGIVSLFVRAFSPEDAKAVSLAALSATEKLVNNLSERARQDTLAKAEEEVRRAEANMRKALFDLKALRDSEGILDPGAAASNISQLLLKALASRISIQNDLTIASHNLKPDSPTVKTLTAQLNAVEEQIGQLRQELTSKNSEASTLSSFLLRFEKLEIQRIFAEKMYVLAESALDRARVKAEQKQVYVSVFVQPTLPQEAKYPQRLAYSLIVPLLLLILWSIFALICAAIDDHRL